MRILGATVDGEALGTVSEALVSVIEEVAAEFITDWVSDGIWDFIWDNANESPDC